MLNTTKLRKPLAILAVSVAGLVTIQHHEGLRLDAYVPVKGDKVTIAHGSTTYPDGSPIKMGDKVTREKATAMLKHDVDKFHTAMVKCINVPISQNEYDAFISLTYNIGSSAFCSSTLVKKLNQKDYAGACSEILRWNRFKGEILKGLDNRRKTEYKTCMNIQTDSKG
jgi:lysozyme